jgi:hypothetical protein
MPGKLYVNENIMLGRRVCCKGAFFVLTRHKDLVRTYQGVVSGRSSFTARKNSTDSWFE